MCLVLPSRVVAVLAGQVEVELADGQHAVVSSELKPDLAVGDYVLVDRGLVIDTIAAEDAQAILDLYAEIGAMLEVEDGLMLMMPASNEPRVESPTNEPRVESPTTGAGGGPTRTELEAS
jgi:hydrogenase assembly chaperone HypC/HupF